MDKNIIKQHLTQRFVNEAKGETATPGITVTNSVNKKSGDVNKKGVKDMEKDLSAYDKALKKGAETTKVPNKFNYNGDSEIEYHNQMETLNGTEMNEYDREPTKEFKDKAKEGLTGSERMGNKGGKDVGNAEETWGASSDDFGKEKDKNIKASTKKRQDAVKGIISFGDDIETVSKDYAPMSKHTAYNENKDNNNKPKIKESMKRLNFKKEFKGVGNALKMIPESYKVDNKVFEMTDGNESYKIRWEGTLTEGKAVVLVASDKTMVNEDMQKMKHLMGYKSQDTLGLVRGKSRINENAVFSDMYKKTKALLEGEDIDDSSAAEGDMDAAVKHAAEAKKHVEGSVSTEKGTQAPAPKTGNLEDVKKKAPEATKHVEGSVSTEKGTQAPAPKTGNWDVNVKGQAPEAKKHVHMSEGIQLGENFFAPMEEGLYEYGSEHEMPLDVAVGQLKDKSAGLDEYGNEHEMPLDTAVKSMSLNKEGMMNEGAGLKNMFSTAKQIASKILQGELTDEDKQDIMNATNKIGDPKAMLSKLSGISQLTPEEEAELTNQSTELAEGWWGDTGKRWAARFSALIGAPASLIASIMGMWSQGAGWADSPILSRVHDMTDAAFGIYGGPVSTLGFFISILYLGAALINFNAGKK
jgi:uncharacterized protein YukE